MKLYSSVGVGEGGEEKQDEHQGELIWGRRGFDVVGIGQAGITVKKQMASGSSSKTSARRGGTRKKKLKVKKKSQDHETARPPIKLNNSVFRGENTRRSKGKTTKLEILEVERIPP